MKKIVTTIVILLLLAGNIYFYLKSKNNKTSPDVNPVKLKNSTTLPSGSNNKALQRAIVLHGNNCVPDNETDEYPICFSYGCPMVSTKYLQKLKGYIAKQGKKPILLSVIY